MPGKKNVNSVVTLNRQPIERDRPAGVTINEIEDRLLELYPGASLDARRSLAMLFAILKEGTSQQKLLWFTRYDHGFIRERLEALRPLAWTGTLSTQYVLDQVPGSEDLIEKTTGQKIVTQPTAHRAPAGYDWQKHVKASPIAPPAPPVAHSRKEEPMNTAINSDAYAGALQAGADTCGKSELCGKPANHLGRCKGPQANHARRAAKPNGQAEAPKKRNTSKPAPARNGRNLQTATQALASITGDGHYKIEYEDETRQFRFEGIGREPFLAALNAARTSVNGGSNG